MAKENDNSKSKLTVSFKKEINVVNSDYVTFKALIKDNKGFITVSKVFKISWVKSNPSSNNFLIIPSPYTNISLAGDYENKLKELDTSNYFSISRKKGDVVIQSNVDNLYFENYETNIKGNVDDDDGVWLMVKNQIIKTKTKAYTLTFDETVQGWTSFHSFSPDLMLRLNNRFYTIKNGQSWLHNEEGYGYNNFYGVQYPSEIKTIFNDEFTEDKIFKTLVLEATKSWAVFLKTNYTESHIKVTEFNQRESRWFAYMRKNENEKDLHSVAQGLGGIIEVNSTEVKVFEIPENVSVGDSLWQVVNDELKEVGIINDYTDNFIKINTYISQPQVGAFCFAKKNSRIEGGEMRGYYMELTLTDNTPYKNELFAIGSEVVKSYL